MIGTHIICTTLHNHHTTQQKLHALLSLLSLFRSQSMFQSLVGTLKSCSDVYVHIVQFPHTHLKKFILYISIKNNTLPKIRTLLSMIADFILAIAIGNFPVAILQMLSLKISVVSRGMNREPSVYPPVTIRTWQFKYAYVCTKTKCSTFFPPCV